MKTTLWLWAVAAALVVADSRASGQGMVIPVRPDAAARGQWALRYHHVDMVVREQVASVTIDQEFLNLGGAALEVEYVFPVPPESAIDSMTLLVNGKEFAAKLLKAEDARAVYESIVRARKDPALLQYAGYGLVKTSAFPLEAGKPARVVMTYKQPCRKDQDLVELSCPLATGRFSGKPIEDIRFKADIKSPADILAVYSPSHDVAVARQGPNQVSVIYQAANLLPTVDFQVLYQESGKDVGATLVARSGQASRDGYFMLLVSPNPRSGASSAMAKDLVLVVDTSGSMAGEKLDQVKSAVKLTLKSLNSQDRFNIIAYNDTIEPVFKELRPAADKDLADAADRVDRLEPTGGTNIFEAVKTALDMMSAKGGQGRPRYIIFLTDGQPTVGKTDEREILSELGPLNGGGVRIFAFGVGYDVNVRLLDKLVGDHGGKSDYVKPKEPVNTKLQSLCAKIKNPVMTNLSVELTGVTLRDMYPRRLGDLFEGDQIVLLGRFDMKGPACAEGKLTSQLVVKGVYEGKPKTFEYPVQADLGSASRYGFVEKLWAMRRVGYLLDQIQLQGKSQDRELIDELIRLSRDYGILTPYTAFLADERMALSESAGDKEKRAEVFRSRGDELARKVDGGKGQLSAVNRAKLNTVDNLAVADKPAGGRAEDADASVIMGNTDVAGYEQNKAEVVSRVRQVGQQAIYQRGSNLWVHANAVDVDLEKDKAKVQDIQRFSDEYFKLVRANTAAENEVFARQQSNEELVIKLRGQVYRVR
jgi:Ca-activated chloride channel family protein